MDISDIEMAPGFTVHEIAPAYTILTVPTGFKLRVDKLGPYAFEDLERNPDYKDPGPFMITVKLLEKIQPPGIDQTIVYTPPTDDNGNIVEPDRVEHERAWMYYQQYLQWNEKRLATRNSFLEARRNRALLLSIHILDGPVSADDNWDDGLDIPKSTSTSGRNLQFLKFMVIRPHYTGYILNSLMFAEEVTIDGLKQTFDTFRHQMARDHVV